MMVILYAYKQQSESFSQISGFNGISETRMRVSRLTNGVDRGPEE